MHPGILSLLVFNETPIRVPVALYLVFFLHNGLFSFPSESLRLSWPDSSFATSDLWNFKWAEEW